MAFVYKADPVRGAKGVRWFVAMARLALHDLHAKPHTE